jgi:hypothetical protein
MFADAVADAMHLSRRQTTYGTGALTERFKLTLVSPAFVAANSGNLVATPMAG